MQLISCITKMLKSLALIGAFLIMPAAFAQEWQSVRGFTQDIAINDEGEVYAVGKDQVVWRWRNDQARWSKISGKLKRIAVGPHGRVWGVGANNNIYRRNGLWWDEQKETALDISIAHDGMIVRVDINDEISLRDKFSNRWKVVYGRKAVRVAATGKDTFWIVQRDGSIAWYDGKFWHDIDEQQALDITADKKGNIFIASLEGPVKKYIKGKWEVMEATQYAASLAVGPEEHIWYTQYDGQTYATSLFAPDTEKKQKELSVISSKTPEEITDSSPIIFTRVKGKSTRLRIGADGSIFSLSSGGSFQRWNNKTNKFRDFPGAVIRFAIDPNGNPWVINSKREIFRHTGKDWKNVSGSAVDISIGSDGKVIISGPNEKLYKLNDRQTAFKPIYGKGYYIALHPNGEIWSIRKNGKIDRCDAEKCTRLKKTGADISIGPDGSVFMADTSNKLYRYDDKKDDWVRVETSRSVKTVGVGPQGRPWIADVNSDVYSSATFERDETNDLKIANATNKETVVTTSTSSSSGVFSFTKKITFDEVLVSFATTDYMGIGLDNRVYVIGDTRLKVNYYKESTKALASLDFSFPEDIKLAVNDADSKAWFLSQVNNNKIGHQKKEDGSSFDYYTFDSSAGIGRDLAIGGNGSVFAVSFDNEIYEYNSSKDDFEKFDNQSASHVAVGISGNPWIIEKTTQLVKYWDGNDFGKPGNKTQTATDIAIGATGKTYIIDTNNDLKKWNASNEDWDDVTINAAVSHADVVAVGSDGRPWILYTSSSGHAYRSDD
jgi:tectonin-like protein